MVIDTSALIAILTGESDAPNLLNCLEADPVRLISAATLLEASIVLETRHGREAIDLLDLFLVQAQIEISPVDRAQALAARMAFFSYGKGRHAAGLNFGDYFAYALAKTRAESLLYKGEDFRRTDIPASRRL